MRTLIIGGTGLISTAITRRLLAAGHEVTLYNRGRTASRLDGDGNGARPTRLTRLTGDRTAYAAFEAQLAAEMAAAGAFDCVIDMVAFQPPDVESVVRVFRERRGPAGGQTQIVFCSTVNVYPLPPRRTPTPEDEPVVAGGVPLAGGAYGRDKAVCEERLRAADARGDVRATVLRVAHAYGEGRAMLHPLGADTAYVDRLRKGKPVVVHGDGTSLWAACHVDDTARAFAGAAGNDVACGRSYNVAGEEWLTWNRYTELFAAAAGGPPPAIVHIPTDVLVRAVPDAGRRCAESYQHAKIYETAAARRDLGFRQTVPFQEGVRRTLDWLDAHGGVASSDGETWYDRLIAWWQGAVGSPPADLARGAAG
jgi:nucleoside-diphosphate-sugar epimerase